VQKVPYMLVVGDREQETGEVGLRKHREGDVGAMPIADAAERLVSEAQIPRAAAV
jgi:threonyl-tRNA synthetase